jgi:1-deoxy-D-xylulose-5-phosphate synthase
MSLLETIESPADIKFLSYAELEQLAQEIREFVISTVLKTGGHLGSNLGVVEITLAVHRVFNSPRDAILFDTGHQTYIHKLITGRREKFATLRQEGGLSGYPNRNESEHDWVENSHASTILSYAQGLATAFAKEDRGEDDIPRRVVAVVGDGSLTGGMAYEALNNLGHSGCPVIIVLNDNGRSYAPTISRLSLSLSHLRMHPSYVQIREKLRKLVKDLPLMGTIAYSSIHGITSALREVIEPHVFFESLGVRYIGPIDGHNLLELEKSLTNATAWNGPIVIHALTFKGLGYPPAEDDDVAKLHDFKLSGIAKKPGAGQTFTEAFSDALIKSAEKYSNLVGITAAMPGPTGLLELQERYPERFFDVGIAEQHAVGLAAGMAMGGLKPVVAVYSTFFSRAYDQAYLDVGLHNLDVVFALDRAGVTGDDGPSHHGLSDMVISLSIPNLRVFAPSTAQDLQVMLETALELKGPSVIRYPKTLPHPELSGHGRGLDSRCLVKASPDIVLLGIGKMTGVCFDAVKLLKDQGISATLWDVRVIRPIDDALLKAISRAKLAISVEDGFRHGGAGQYIAEQLSPKGTDGPDFITMGLPNEFIAHAKPDVILERYGLDAKSIAEVVKKKLVTHI